MAIKGSLADVSLADICQLLSLGQKTGCLTVTDQSNFGYVYFEKGRVVFASVLNRPDRLGDLLVKQGLIDEQQLEEAMEAQAREGDRRLGEILLEKGVVAQDELHKWIGLQVEEAVYHLFAWSEGTFHFKPDETPDGPPSLLVSLSVDGLLLEGARRVDEWALIEEEVHSLDLVFQKTRDPADEELTGNQTKILALLDGQRTVWEVVDESGLVEFEAGKAIYELVQGGYAEKTGERTPPPEEGEEAALREHVRLGQAFYRAGMFEDASREFLHALKLDPSEPYALFRLGLIHLKANEAQEALVRFDALPEEWAKRTAVMRNRALALELLHRYEEAVSVLREAQEQDASDLDVILARGICELKSGDAGRARATFTHYRNRVGKGTPPAIYFAHAVLAAAAAGDLEGAASLGREGLNLHPTEVSILVNTGAVLDHKGDHEAAEQYFMRALNAGSDVPAQAHKNLGDQAFRRGDKSGAQSHYERAIQIDPALGDDVFLKLGIIASEGEDTGQAVLHLGRALELNPENEEARVRLASVSP